MTINEIQDEIIEEFSGLDDWMDKYQLLIDLGNELAPLDERYKTEQIYFPHPPPYTPLLQQYLHPQFCPPTSPLDPLMLLTKYKTMQPTPTTWSKLLNPLVNNSDVSTIIENC